MILWALCIAFAGRASEAEAERLTSEIAMLEQRGAWKGVDRAYQRALATEEPLPEEVHVAGARASLQAGNADEARERLLSAYEVNRTPSLLEWLTTFSREYSRLHIRVDPGVTLEIERRHFDPDRARIVDRAAEILSATQRFDGLLPVGRYRAGSFWFKIEPDGADIVKDLRACTAAPPCPEEPVNPLEQHLVP